ncbi:PP2C family protein-serine/threonine phosphatase [Pseudorhodoferax sp.]|uniref:PP2C family protein-serine/threonine phosphatase n=1 Tax=Pseudorhodoferax sp. TaxID=1993553 RepID=UPI002DD6A8FB|nr:protein phosphatase 2C domain-containing protein [Pseudorhodoferax sp.]
MKFSVFQVSRRGGRARNEDRMGYCYTRESGLFVLADGMGGHPEGDVAAQLAVQTVSSLHQQQATPRLAQAGDFLVHALLAAHRRILRYGNERGLADMPRTTLVAAVLQGDCASWVHCGDSRLYLVRGGALLARTRDHSYLEQMTPEATNSARVSRNMLFTCLGSPVPPVYHMAGPVPLQRGDKLLLCSDGLWSSVSDESIVEQLSSMPVAQAVPELVEQALRAAGDSSDNVTALALEWQTADAFASTRGQGAPATASGAFAATVQNLDAAASAADLDDAAIERSIAEINAAIRESAKRKF